jgi:prephenate dehydrogenase
MKFEKITVVGLGLIGGSLARALKESGQVGTVAGVDTSKDTIEYALENGVADSASADVAEGVSGADIIVIATHVGIIADTVKTVSQMASEGAVITDVGSVKSSIINAVEPEMPGNIHFVAGHPIAGTENSGVQSADADLFKGRRTILTPTDNTDSEAKSKVKEMWVLAGSTVYEMDPGTHDHIFGIVSHLPHVIAYSLMNTVLNAQDSELLMEFAGGGLKDYTRVAASSPEMWVNIFKSNKDQLLEAISKFKISLQSIEDAIQREDFDALLEELNRAASAKRSL